MNRVQSKFGKGRIEVVYLEMNNTNPTKIQGSSSSLTMGTHPVTLATNSVIIHE